MFFAVRFVSFFLIVISSHAVNNWGKGINLGNTLDAPHEGDWAPVAQEYFFDDYKSAGFESVRIPIRWDEHFGKSSPFAIDATFMNRVDQVVGWCLDRNLTCLINSHHDDWLDDESQFYNQLPRFKALWTQISEHFKDYPDNLYFEIYNEPHAMNADQMNQMNQEIYDLIRKSNPHRVIHFGGLGWYGIWWILANQYSLKIPGGGSDPNLWLHIHDYDPFCFTTPQCGGPMITQWGSEQDVQTIKDSFSGLSTWLQQHAPRTPVILGEFATTVEQPCESCRSLWYTTYIGIMDQYPNIHGWALWDDSGWFKIYDRSARSFDDLVLKAIGMK